MFLFFSFYQTWLVFSRSLIQQLRSPVGLLFDICLPIFSALFLGMIFYNRYYKAPIISLLPNCKRFILLVFVFIHVFALVSAYYFVFVVWVCASVSCARICARVCVCMVFMLYFLSACILFARFLCRLIFFVSDMSDK